LHLDLLHRIYRETVEEVGYFKKWKIYSKR